MPPLLSAGRRAVVEGLFAPAGGGCALGHTPRDVTAEVESCCRGRTHGGAANVGCENITRAGVRVDLAAVR